MASSGIMNRSRRRKDKWPSSTLSLRNVLIQQKAVLQKPGVWRSRPVASQAQALTGLVIYQFTHSLYYANAQQFSEEIAYLANNAKPPLRWLCIDASAVDDIDCSAAEILRSIYAILKGKEIRLIVAQVMDDVKEECHYELHQLFGEEAFYDSLQDVVKAYRQQYQE